MRQIVIGAFLSLDGIMQAPGGPEEDTENGFKHGGWTVPYWDDSVGAFMGTLFSRPHDLLLGRKTYDIFAAYWPLVETDPNAANYDKGMATFAKTINGVIKYVATHHPESLQWQNSEILGDDVIGQLRKLKASEGPDLIVQGSTDLIQQLMAADLVDELHVLIYPVVLGKGKKLFGGGANSAAYKLVSSSVSSSGVIMASYRREGDIKTGSFALE